MLNEQLRSNQEQQGRERDRNRVSGLRPITLRNQQAFRKTLLELALQKFQKFLNCCCCSLFMFEIPVVRMSRGPIFTGLLAYQQQDLRILTARNNSFYKTICFFAIAKQQDFSLSQPANMPHH
jgi:hypothetical protein